ncbi:MAG: TVP38/TMEM64 family protein [Acidobacteriota bacterium]
MSNSTDRSTAAPKPQNAGTPAAGAPAAGTPAAGRPWGKIVGALAALLALGLLLRFLGPKLAPIVADFLAWVDSLGVWAPVAYIIGYALATVLMIPGSLLTLAGGVLFGLWKGTALVFVGASLGATLAFLIARYLARGAIERRLEGNERFAVIDRAVGKQGTKVVFLLRLVPFFPFVWLNYGLGLTKVRLRDYVIGCIGMLPGTFLYVYYGKAIGSLAALADGSGQAEQGIERWIFLGLGLVAAFAVTALITRIARKELQETTDRDLDALNDA